jgi:hypothetical protein
VLPREGTRYWVFVDAMVGDALKSRILLLRKTLLVLHLYLKFVRIFSRLGQRLWEVEITSFEVLEITLLLTVIHLPAICNNYLIIAGKSKKTCGTWCGINMMELNMGSDLRA